MSAREGEPLFKRERDLGDFLVKNLEHLGVLIISREVRTPYCGRIDLLGMDAFGNLVVIELKLGATKPEAVAQVLEYWYWVKDRSRDELIEIASRQPLCIDLPKAFVEYYGHALPAIINQAQTLAIVASTFDATTYHGVAALNEFAALNKGGFSVRVLQYFEDRASIRIAPFFPSANAEDSTPVPDERLPRFATLRRSGGPYRAHEDTRDFWEIVSPQFVWPFVPFRFVADLYVNWCRSEESEGRYRRAQQWGQLGRQLAALVGESNRWTHVQICPGTLMEKDEPLARRLSNWVRPDPDKRVFGYLRTVANVAR